MPTKYVGNLVISMKTIDAMIAQSPRASITLVIDDTFDALCRLAFGDRVRILSYPRQALRGHSVLSRIRRYVNFIRALRSQRFDHLMDIDGTVVSARVTRLARAGVKVGPNFAKRPEVYDRLVEMIRESQHCFEDFAVMARTEGFDVPPDRYFNFPVAPSTTPFVTGLTKLDGHSPIACIHPCATKDYKEWQIEGFAQLADKLDASGYQVVILGAGKSEVPRIERLMALTNSSPVNAHNHLSLTQLVTLLQHASIFIGNDSGPMHLAAATGIPVIALFGPTELHRWHPLVEKIHIIKGRETCHPDCQTEACLADYRCLRSITADQIMKVVTTMQQG